MRKNGYSVAYGPPLFGMSHPHRAKETSKGASASPSEVEIVQQVQVVGDVLILEPTTASREEVLELATVG